MDSPIAKLTVMYKNRYAEKQDLAEANRLMLKLYLAIGPEVMLTSNLWVDVGLHNGAKGKVVDFVYKNANEPCMNKGEESPEDVVVKFHSMEKGIKPFLDGVPNTVTIPVVSD